MAQIGDTSLFNDANFVAYYKLEDVNDSKGSNNLTNNGTTPFSAAKYNNGADFGTGNSSKYFNVASNLGVDHTAITISFWVKLNAEVSSSNQDFVTVRTTGGGTNYIDWKVFYYDPGGTKTLFFDRSKPGVADQGPQYAVTLGTSVFHHIVMTYNGTNIVGYVDGVDVTGNSAASGVGSAGANNSYIGANPTPTNWCNCIIDDVGVFTRALTAAEVLTLYNETASVRRGYSFII